MRAKGGRVSARQQRRAFLVFTRSEKKLQLLRRLAFKLLQHFRGGGGLARTAFQAKLLAACALLAACLHPPQAFGDTPPRPISAPALADSALSKASGPGREALQVTEVIESLCSNQTISHGAARLNKSNERRARAVEAFLSALHFEQAGDHLRALELYRRCLDLDPRHAALALKVARDLLRQGLAEAALDTLKNAEAASPGSEELLLAIADILWRVLNKPEAALAAARRAWSANPDSPDAFAFLHTLHLLLRDSAAADALLRSAMRGNSKNPHLWFHLAGTLARQSGTLPRSLRIPSLSELPPEAAGTVIRLAKRGLSLSECDSAALTAGADLLLALGKADEAANIYKKAADAAPGDAVPRERLARTLIALGKDSEAITALEDLAVIDPSRAGIFELLGDLYQKTGQREKAAEAYDKGLELVPSDPLTYIKAARLTRELRRYDRAVSILDSSLKSFAAVPELQLELALTLSLAGRHIEALEVMKGLLTAAENGTSNLDLQTVAYLAAGVAYKAREFDLAAGYYKQAIEAGPATAASAYNDLGYMWLEQGKNLDEAGELIRRAVEMEPDNGAFLDSLGWYHHKKGNHQEALSWLLKAEAAAPAEPPEARAEFLAVIRDHIGDAHAALGNTAEAVRYWKLSLADDPSNVAVAEKIERGQKHLTSSKPIPDSAPR